MKIFMSLKNNREYIELHRSNGATSPTGIYRCEIPTNAVHDDKDISVRATVYVGLYTSAGKFVSQEIVVAC